MRYSLVIKRASFAIIFCILFTGVFFISIGAFYSAPNPEDLSIAAGFKKMGISKNIFLMLLYNDGRYSTNFFHGVSPLSWHGHTSYFILPIFSFASFAFSITLFLRSILSNLNHINVVIFGIGISVLFFSTIESIGETLYCWGGTLVYVFPCTFSLLWISMVILFSKKKEISYLMIAAIFLFITSGFNEMFLAFTGINMAVLLGYSVLYGKQYLKYYIPLIGVGLSGMMLMLFLPGSWEKADTNNSIICQLMKIDFWQFFIAQHSKGLLNFYLNIWVWFYLFATVIFSSIFYSGQSNDTYIRQLRFVSIIMFLSTFFMAVIFYLPMSDGVSYPTRIYTPLYFVWFFSTSIFLFSITLNFRNRISNCQRFEFLSGVLLILCLIGILNSRSNYNLMFHEFISGAYHKFKSEKKQQFSALSNTTNNKKEWKVAVITPLTTYPRTIYNPTEVEPNRAMINWNFAFEEYFEIDEVRLLGDTLIRFKFLD